MLRELLPAPLDLLRAGNRFHYEELGARSLQAAVRGLRQRQPPGNREDAKLKGPESEPDLGSQLPKSLRMNTVPSDGRAFGCGG